MQKSKTHFRHRSGSFRSSGSCTDLPGCFSPSQQDTAGDKSDESPSAAEPAGSSPSTTDERYAQSFPRQSLGRRLCPFCRRPIHHREVALKYDETKAIRTQEDTRLSAMGLSPGVRQSHTHIQAFHGTERGRAVNNPNLRRQPPVAGSGCTC